jgi:hypothetical protein
VFSFTFSIVNPAGFANRTNMKAYQIHHPCQALLKDLANKFHHDYNSSAEFNSFTHVGQM